MAKYHSKVAILSECWIKDNSFFVFRSSGLKQYLVLQSGALPTESRAAGIVFVIATDFLPYLINFHAISGRVAAITLRTRGGRWPPLSPSSCPSPLLLSTSLFTELFNHENEKLNSSFFNHTRGNNPLTSHHSFSYSADNCEIIGPPGYSRPIIFDTLSKASPPASS